MNTHDVIQVLASHKVLSLQSLQERIRQAQSLDRNSLFDLVRGRAESEIVRMDWDNIVFGVSEGELVQVMLQDLTPDPMDLENVTGIDLRQYFKGIAPEKLPPLDIAIEYGELYLVDGHHRWTYASKLGKKTMQATVSIRDNPLEYLGVTMDELVEMSKKATG